MKLHRVVFALALAAILGPAARADFPISTNVNLDIQPQVAYNSANQEYLVVWGEMVPFGQAFIPGRILGQRVGEDGTLLGSAFQIFSNGTYSRVAYNPALNEYLVITAPGTGILGQRVSNSGTLIGGSIALMTDQSYGRLLYNELSADYLLVAGQLVETSAGSGYWNLKIYSRRLSATAQPTGSLVFIDEIADGYGGPEPVFAVAYAPIQSPETPNGRYLMVTGRGIMVTMLNSEGAPINVVYDPYHPGTTYRYVPFRTGSGVGGEFNVDVAYGTESGYSMTGPAFFVVWADQNNRWQNQQWSGIYGGFIDANRISYATDEVIKDNAFPISAIADHWAYDSHVESWRPRVAYNAPAGKYMVTWRETPGTSSYNDTKVNHIRADKEFEAITMNPNDVLSSTTGNENPEEPAIASSTISGKGLVAWIDYRNSATTKQDIYGTVYTIADVPPPPPPPPTTTWIVTNTNDAGGGSLRQAILNANARLGMDTIAFNIPGGGVHTIQPLSPLPTITDPVLIDGYTQPAASLNTNPFASGTNAVLKIEIDGTNASSNSGLFRILSGNSTMRGLAINRCWLTPNINNTAVAITIESGGQNVVEGNWFGMDPTGKTSLPNNIAVSIHNSADNRIGGTQGYARNAFGMGLLNVMIYGSAATGNIVQGNYIGVLPGTPLPGVTQTNNGIGIQDASSNLIGGTDEGSANLIYGQFGILLAGHSEGNRVEGNLIGTEAGGTGNSQCLVSVGIFVADSANGNVIGGKAHGAGNIVSADIAGIMISGSQNELYGNRIGVQSASGESIPNNAVGISLSRAIHPVESNIIGGTAEGEGNTIAHNGKNGIVLSEGVTRTRITGNSIFSNGKLSIDLVGGSEDAAGVTANDPGDADAGPNGLQNYPVLTFAMGGDYLWLKGLLNSQSNTTYRLEFFSTPKDQSVAGRDGKNYLGWIDVTTDGNGNASFEPTVGTAVGLGQLITATATDPNGNTSEFSAPLEITLVPGTEVVTNTLDSGPGSFRQAIINANAKPGRDTITFSIPGPGQHTIAPLTSLPEITDPIVIDGYSQPGSRVNTNSLGAPWNAALMIVLSGSQMTNYGDGLSITGGGSCVRGVTIQMFPTCIALVKKGGNVIEGNYLSESFDGVRIDSSASNFIGGTTPEARNVIGNTEYFGVAVQHPGSRWNRVQGNYIGVDATGTHALPNGMGGLLIYNATSNTIGGTTAGAGNVIAGYANSGTPITEIRSVGIQISDSSSGNSVVGNLIGTTASGDDSLQNGGKGILVGGKGNIIGGISAAARNIVSGNTLGGIEITGDSNYVLGNYIGTDVTGSKALGNRSGGVIIRGTRNHIGGVSPSAGNLISANALAGIVLDSTGTGNYARYNLVQGNRIGTQHDGASPLGNTGPGVLVRGWAVDDTIGGTADGAGNVIAFNSGNGVCVIGDNVDNPVLPTGIRISRNSIYENGRLGIDLVGEVEDANGITANDPGDADTGPNSLQNSPVLTSALGGNSPQIRGSLISSANSSFTLEFFATPCEGTPKPGDGQTYLGSTSVQTDAGGNAPFDITLNVPVGSGRAISATATNHLNNTSEFSLPVLVTSTDVAMIDDIPKTMALMQNYPNPFNPKTGVRYQVASVSDVQITVYDILGREVAVLVNERKTPGSYEVPFDASGLASGMYIYRLTAGSFVATKTMLLVK